MAHDILQAAGCKEFYLPALAFEREASERYRDFEAWFVEHGLTELGALCARCGGMHGEDCSRITGAAGTFADREIDALRRPWIGTRPDDAQDELFYGLATARQIIEIALAEETAAARRFGDAARALPDAQAQQLAAALVASSRRCAEALAAAKDSAAPPDWEAIIADGGGPCLALGAERRLRRT